MTACTFPIHPNPMNRIHATLTRTPCTVLVCLLHQETGHLDASWLSPPRTDYHLVPLAMVNSPAIILSTRIAQSIVATYSGQYCVFVILDRWDMQVALLSLYLPDSSKPLEHFLHAITSIRSALATAHTDWPWGALIAGGDANVQVAEVGVCDCGCCCVGVLLLCAELLDVVSDSSYGWL